MFKHILITQFNLLQFPLGQNNHDEWVNWTRERIDLFKKFCLPSILNQTVKNFTWLIYFDLQTPKEFYSLIEKLKSYSFIEPLFSDGFDGFMTDHIDDLRNYSNGNEWIITSRCDNDDSLHKKAISKIQENFIPSNEHLISLTSGYTYNIETQEMSHYYYPMSPFISIIERRNKKQIKGIFNVEHTRWDALRLFIKNEILRKNHDSTFILERPYWIQVIHGKNVSNSAQRGMPVLKKLNLIEFGLDMTNKKQTILNIPSYYNYVWWKRYFKSAFVKMWKSVFRIRPI